MADYAKINRELWNARTPVHAASDFYDLDAFRAGRCSLNAPELELLGDVSGREILHLQCHFGQDSLSLARRGAKVTGLDLSDESVKLARQLAAEMKLPADFVRSDVLETDKALKGRQFDTVFTSYGVIGWLPELKNWGRIISEMLRPGGELVFVEFHPAVWMFDDNFTKIAYSYFNKGPLDEVLEGTYTEGGELLKNESLCWNHPLSDVTKTLLSNGLEIKEFDEFDTSPYDCFKGTVAVENGWQIAGLEGKIPMIYALKAVKKA